LIDFAFTNDKAPQKGKILLSDPFLDEEYFRRSIVFLCEISEEGSFGFVLNNLIEVNLQDIDSKLPAIKTKLSLGGPVETGSLYFLHSLGEQVENSLLIHDNICIGGDFEQLSNLLKEDPDLINQVRFFIGYAGWGLGQLEAEIAENSWIVSNLNPIQEVFDIRKTNSWEERMNLLGGKYKVISKFPLDPNQN
jgi:putative transcriptional regulator